MTPGTVNRICPYRVYDCLKIAQSLLYPPHCQLCGDSGATGYDLCSGCRADLRRLEGGCLQCAQPLPGVALFCGACLRRNPAFDRVHAPYHYAPPIDGLIKKLKFHGSLAAGRLLGQLLGDFIAAREQPLPQVMIPVPLHPRRLRERGFNQALELARPLQRRLGVPLAPTLLRRSRDTKTQSDLPARARRGNVRGAFTLSASRVPRHCAIVDDVMTTGHTVDELARLLRRAGACRVEVWVVARTGAI